METGSRAGVLLAALLATSAIACPPELRVSGDRLFLPVTVNGIETEALLDSGAEMTLLDAGFARRTGFALEGSETIRGTGGSDEVSFAQGADLRTVGVSLEDRTVAVLDLGDISERLVGEPVHAIVGRELFDSGRFYLDIGKRQFCRIDREAEPAGARLRLAEHRGIMQFPVVIEDLEPVQADFDLGNGSEVLIGRDYALANGLLDPGRFVGRSMGGGIGGAVSRDLVRLDKITVAGVPFTGVIAAVDPTGNAAAANIGVAILRNFTMTIDFPQQAVWLLAVGSDD